MNDEADALAKKRFFMIGAVRIFGAVTLALGLAIINNGFAGLPAPLGYVLGVIGMIDMLVIPVLLARRWKSPTDL